MKNHSLVTVIVLLLIQQTNAQNIEGYSFEDYGAKKYVLDKKAKIDYQSNPTAKKFRTKITQAYTYGQIDFAGCYITAIWGCGTSCVNGVIIDTRDGKVYDLPLNSETAHDICFLSHEQDFRLVRYKSFSRLLVTQTCLETNVEGSEDSQQTYGYFIYVWNESEKRFDWINKIEKISLKKNSNLQDP